MSNKIVVDTNIFQTILFNHFKSSSPAIYEGLEKMINDEIIISVPEVLRECDAWNDTAKQWLIDNKKMFQKPKPEECEKITEILSTDDFMSCVKKQNLLEGKPVADPFIVSKAIYENGIVATAEGENSNIPKMCRYYKIKYIGKEEFLEMVSEYSGNSSDN